MSEGASILFPEKFDYAFSKELLDTYNDIFSRVPSGNVFLDFSRVQYIDSSALGMLVLLNKKAQEKNLKLTIRGARGEAADILKMANIQKIFDLQ